MLKIDLKPGEEILIGNGIKIKLERKSGKIARLSIEAGKDVPIKHEKNKSSDAGYAAKFGIAV